MSIKGNQVEVRPAQGGETHWVHVIDIKKILPADNVIAKLPSYEQFGRKTTLRLDPKRIPDLKWQLTTQLNTVPKITVTSVDNKTILKS